MPQLNTIVLKDGAGADATYSPENIANGTATLVESTGVPIGENHLSITTAKLQTGRRKVTLKLTSPEVQDIVVAGISRPTIVRTAYAEATFSFDQTSNELERFDILSRMITLLQGDAAWQAVAKLKHLY